MQRVTSFVLALLIFGSAVVSAIFVIQAIRSEEKDSSNVVDQTTDTSTTEPTAEETANMLEGKQMPNFTPTTERVTELKIEDLVEGTGETVATTATITAHYTGALVATGVIFQSSKDTGQPFTAPLSNLIVGWQTGIPGMKVGGTRRLTIPAAQAYGASERPGIPADSDLVFDIELISATN